MSEDRNRQLRQLSIPNESMHPREGAVRQSNHSYQESDVQRKSPLLAVSADYYNHAILIPTRGESSQASIEMSMKTIEMLAMIKGTTYEEASLLDAAVHLDDDGRTSTEGSSVPRQSQGDFEFELDFDDDYLVGDTFIGYSEDCCDLEYSRESPAEELYEPEEEMFEIDM